MVGGRTKKYRVDEMHDKGVLGCSGSQISTTAWLSQ